jgi:ABC-type glycerol-3-phosphate transport system substrate-binding protein
MPEEATPVVQETADATQDFTIERNELVIWVPDKFSILDESPASLLLRQHIEDFERQNPGVVVTVRVKASSGTGGILDSLKNTKIAASAALPQLVLLPSIDLPDAMAQQLILPVEDFSSHNNPSTYFDYAQEMAEVNGVPYGFPFVGDALVGIASANIGEENFTSWEDIRAEKEPLYFAANNPQASLIISQYLSTGGSLEDDQGHASFSTDALMTVLDAFEQNTRNSIFTEDFVTLNTSEDVWSLFENEDADWVINWASRALQSDLPDLLIFQLPSLSTEAYVSANGWAWAVVNSEELMNDTLSAFITFMNDPEFLAQYSQVAGYLPVMPDSLSLYEDDGSLNRLSNILLAAHTYSRNDLILELGPIFRDATLSVLSQDFTWRKSLRLHSHRLRRYRQNERRN